MTDPSAKSTKLDSTLSKGLAVLEDLATARRSKGVTELSRDLGLTKSNTFRLLQTLAALGYVKHGDHKTYAATLKTWQVGRELVDNLNLRELAAPELAHLSKQTQEAVYLAVPENLQVIYIDKIESRQPIRSWNPVGGSAPIHCVSTGKAILAANYKQMRGKLIGQLTRYTDRSLTSIERLDQDIIATNARGFAYDTGEFRDRVVGFGAPITLPDGEAIAALGVSLPDINMTEDGQDIYGELVRDAANSVSQKLLRS